MILLTILSGLVFAQSTESKKETVHKLDFEDVELTGVIKKPNGQLIQERTAIDFNPLIQIRENFQPEMQRSINEIK